MSRARSGLNLLGYMGVEPVTPPNLNVFNRTPTINDTQNFNIGDMWLDTSASPNPAPYMLVSLAEGEALWLPFGGSGGGGTLTFTTDTLPVIPVGNTVFMAGGSNINTDGVPGSQINFNLNDTVTIANNFTTNSGDIRALLGNISAPAGSLTIGTTASIGTGLTVQAGGILSTGTTRLTSLTAGVMQTQANGTVISTNGTNGQVIIGGGTAPNWASITSLNGTVVLTAGANTLNLEAVGAGAVGAVNFNTDSGSAVVDGVNITITGGTNINTSGAAHAVTVNLDSSVVLPTSNSSGTQGWLSLGSAKFLHNYGLVGASPDGTSYNTYLGRNAGAVAGSVTNAAISNTGIGGLSLNSITTGHDNTGLGKNTGTAVTTAVFNTLLGSQSGQAITTGNDNVGVGAQTLLTATTSPSNVAIGFAALNSITTGTGFNIAIGNAAGVNLNATETSNILIGNAGTGGQSHTIRIGTQGSATGNQNKAFMAGVSGGAGLTVPNSIVICDSNGQLSTTPAAGPIQSNGSLLIGSSAAGGSVQWGNIAAGSGITVTNASHSITIATKTNNCAFLYNQIGNVNNVTGSGVVSNVYFLGTQLALTLMSDVGGNVTAGGAGQPTTFTAPVNGLYYLQASVLTINLNAPHPSPPPPAPPPPIVQCPITISTTHGGGQTYQLVNSVYGPQVPTDLNNGQQSYFMSALCPMNAGETAIFGVSINYNGSIANTLGVGGIVGTQIGTFVCGYIVNAF